MAAAFVKVSFDIWGGNTECICLSSPSAAIMTKRTDCPASVTLLWIELLNVASMYWHLFCVTIPMSRLMTKPTKCHVRPAKTQISLGIRPVWSESSLSAWKKLGSLATQWAHSEDSDQTGRMPRLNWVFWSDWADAQADLSLRWAHSHFVGFVTRRLILNVCTGDPYR